MIDPRTLEILHWVVALGGFRAAAERLHTTQPAVSARIAQLEQACGARLLLREPGRKVVPTPRGLEILAYAGRILALQAELATAIADPGGLRGTVRVGTAETIVHTWLSAFVRAVHARHPHLVLDITVDVSSRLADQLLAGEVDCALLLGPVAGPLVENAPLCRYGLAWVGRPGLVAPDTGLDGLARFPLITYPRDTAPYRELAGLVRAGTRSAPRLFAIGSLAAMVRMVTDGIGIGVIAEAAIGAELAAGSLVRLPGPALSPLVFTASTLADPAGGAAAAVSRIAQEIAAADQP